MFARLWSLLRLPFLWKISNKKFDETTENPPDCIIVLAFGQEEELIGLGAGLYTTQIVPGPANEAIAKVVTTNYLQSIGLSRSSAPTLAQWEFVETRAFGRNRVMVALGSRSVYRNTYEVLQEAKAYMDGKKWSKAVIVAHPWHLRRCIWTAQKVGIRVIHDQLITRELNELANVWNGNVAVPSDQRQTTSLRRWIPYELAARGYSWYKGWI